MDKKRLAFYEIRDRLETQKIIILSGLRNIGKTTVLKQLQMTSEIYQYFDCRMEKDLYRLDEALKHPNGVLLIDEFHHHPNCYSLSEKLDYLVNDTGVKCVITSSSIHFCNLLAFNTLGGGRSFLVRMPILTFTEFLVFSGRCQDYNVLSKVTEDDFISYTQYRGSVGFPKITEQYITELVTDLRLVYENYPVHMGNFKFNERDIRNAFQLLSYNLQYDIRLDTLISPKIGAKEMSGQSRKVFLESKEYHSFSITKSSLELALKDDKSYEDVYKALCFLLWSNLVVVIAVNEPFDCHSLPRVAEMTPARIEQMFEEYQFIVINPLFYSLILDELGSLTEEEVWSVLTERVLLGHWVEMYLRSSHAHQKPHLILHMGAC